MAPVEGRLDPLLVPALAVFSGNGFSSLTNELESKRGQMTHDNPFALSVHLRNSRVFEHEARFTGFIVSFSFELPAMAQEKCSNNRIIRAREYTPRKCL